MKRGELKRKSALKRRPLPKKRSQRRPLSAPARIKAEGWHRGLGVCVACRRVPATEAHHIIRVQTLRREAKSRGFDFERVRWDHRNRLPLCELCHVRHHKRVKVLALSLVLKHAPKVTQFAREIGLAHVLDRDYATEPQ